MQLLDIDIISKGPYTQAFAGLSEGEKRLARLSGITQAVMVRASTPGQFEIIGDSRAWYLAQAIQVHQIPVLKVDHLSENELTELVKPVSEELGVIDRAEQVFEMLPEYKSKAALGRAHNMPRALVCNLIRIHAMDDDIKEQIAANPTKVKLGHAKAIAGLNHMQQNLLLHEIIINGLSVHATEARAREIQSVRRPSTSSKSPEVTRLEQEVSALIGCSTKINEEEGRVVIDYQKDLDVLSGVLVRIGYVGD